MSPALRANSAPRMIGLVSASAFVLTLAACGGGTGAVVTTAAQPTDSTTATTEAAVATTTASTAVATTEAAVATTSVSTTATTAAASEADLTAVNDIVAASLAAGSAGDAEAFLELWTDRGLRQTASAPDSRFSLGDSRPRTSPVGS